MKGVVSVEEVDLVNGMEAINKKTDSESHY